ncbi:MAG TPA: PAS domain S-box protein, partial [Steroidobacteraceae bacterium]
MTNSAQVGQPALPVREETTAVRPDSGLTTTINAALRLPGDAGEGSLTAPLHAQLQAELAATGVQLSRSTHAVHALLARVSAHYHQIDEERRGIVRSMQIMAHEAESLTHDLAEQNSGHLRLILDHIKDAVITVDANGLIETFNPTGERIFGYTEAEVLGRRLDLLVLGIAEQGSVEVGLRRLALSHEGARAGTIACEAIGRRKGGTEFSAEIAVSAARQGRRDFFVVCLRDASDRHTSELAMRESEARYRTLVDHAPEVICVYDVDAGKFADVNDHAVRFFKMTREELLKVGPNVLSPPTQPDGKSSVDAPRGYIANALAGTPQTFEWVHRDACGNDIACEVRLTRMPSATRRLLRGSITDISDRKRADLIASGEREVFAKLAANDSLPSVLEAIARLIESVCPGHRGTVSVLAADGKAFAYVVAPLLPAAVRQILESASIDIRDGSCAAAVYLGRQVIVADIDKDPFWERRRGPVTAA